MWGDDDDDDGGEVGGDGDSSGDHDGGGESDGNCGDGGDHDGVVMMTMVVRTRVVVSGSIVAGVQKHRRRNPPPLPFPPT